MREEVSVGMNCGINDGHEPLSEVVEAMKKDARRRLVDESGGEGVSSTVSFAPSRPDGGLKTRCVALKFSHSSTSDADRYSSLDHIYTISRPPVSRPNSNGHTQLHTDVQTTARAGLVAE